MSVETPVVSTAKPRVLVVDDSRVIRRAMSKTLAAHFDVVEMEDGEQAWSALAADSTIEVVVTDLEMPRLDGHGLLARIRGADAPLRDLPVIVVTGADDEGARIQAFAAGASDFITKPIDNVQLLARVRSHSRLEETTRKLAQTSHALEEQATQDPLTHLATRRFFLQCAGRDLAFATRHGAGLSVVRFVIDDFKGMFARHGDDKADALLAELAQLLLARIRHEDTAARIAGAEFAVLIPSAGAKDSLVFVERLRTAVNERGFHSIDDARITLSIGVASLDEGTTTIQALLTQAERNMQRAQANGGNRIESGTALAVPVVSAPVAPAATQAAPLATIDEALELIAAGREEELSPHLTQLAARLLPLLDLCNRRLGLGLGFAIKSLREKVTRSA